MTLSSSRLTLTDEILETSRNWLGWLVMEFVPFEAVQHLVVDRFDPDSRSRPTLSLVPQSSLTEFFLPLNFFDVSPNGKNGCGGLKKTR